MSESGRVTSTARKFSRAWMRRLIWIFIRLNVVLLLLVAVGFCYYHEKAVLGGEWTVYLERRLDFPHVPDGANILEDALQHILALPHAVYQFGAPDGLTHSVPLQNFTDAFLPLALALIAFEVIFCFGQMVSGRRLSRRLLRPLDKMARAARELTRTAAYVPPTPPQEPDDEKLHDLEDAISRISPNRPEEKLQMGDRDLQGLQDAINNLLTRMHESYRQQAQFVSDASHELRTPIAVIQGYAGMLDRWGKQDEKILDESISAIKSEAAYMSRLIEQLLFLARGDTGRNRMEFKQVSLGELMKEVYEDSLVIDKNHDWRIDVQENVLCRGDWDMLKQCARILADNALKYTPEGGVIFLRAYSNADGAPCMEVQDSGIGISGEDLQHVFDRFYRSDPARGRASGGTGLGLAIAKWIVDRHGGHFDVLSREKLGTRMTVCLPQRGEEA